MTIEQKISMALAYKGMSQAALAREIGTSPANLNQRMKRGSFTAEEMEKIAAALGAKYFFGFDFEDGKITYIMGESGKGKTTLLRIVAGIDTDFIGNHSIYGIAAIVSDNDVTITAGNKNVTFRENNF